MARWDEILTLPVQNPTTLEFSAADIVWSRVEGWRENMDRLALIPFTRVNDFVRGESNNKDCPTRFHVEARRRRPPESAYKPKVDGILEYILYWCSFGPDDHRKGGVVRPSRSFATKRKTPAGRPNTKRGCVCHFIVKRLIAEPSVALIIYNQDKHVDKKGLPCHGPQDKMAAGTQAMFAPYISDELRLQLISLLYVGIPVETIMQRHTEAVERQGGPCNRDDLLTHRYVRRLERKIRRSTYELDSDDATSINMWIEDHRDHIFFFEDFSDSEPFVLGIQTEWQLQQLIHFGNRSLLAADSRFGTNKLKYPIYSLLVFDSNNNAIPVAWILTPTFASGEINRWMGALYDRVHSKDPTWKLGGFIVDDPSADIIIIREVFQCSVMVSFWRVRHAWHKNLMGKCSGAEMRAEMSRRLGEIVSSICRGNADINSFEVFMEDFVDCSDFLDYFKAAWYPRIGLWTTALKTLSLASTEVSAAIECYHTQLKLRLLNEKDSSNYQRADWLVDKLGTKVHSYYWLDAYAGKENFARYWKDEWKSGLSSWQQALQIPDSDVIVDGKCAKVVSSKDRDVLHVVVNPGSEFALCDCSWSRAGNLCKHVIKSAKLYRDKGLASATTGLFEYSRTLMNILKCPPHDSLIRDHAMALAVSVQSQLKALLKLTNNTVPGIYSTENVDNPHHDLMDQGLVKSHSSANNNDAAMREHADDSHDDMAVDTCPDEATKVGSDAGISDTIHENSISETRMEVDPPLTRCSTSPTNGVEHKIKSSDVLAGHKLDSVVSNAVEVSNGFSHGTEKKTVVIEACSQLIVERIILDEACDNMENGNDENTHEGFVLNDDREKYLTDGKVDDDCMIIEEADGEPNLERHSEVIEESSGIIAKDGVNIAPDVICIINGVS